MASNTAGMLQPQIFESLQQKIDEDTTVRDVCVSLVVNGYFEEKSKCMMTDVSISHSEPPRNHSDFGEAGFVSFWRLKVVLRVCMLIFGRQTGLLKLFCPGLIRLVLPSVCCCPALHVMFCKHNWGECDCPLSSVVANPSELTVPSVVSAAQDSIKSEVESIQQLSEAASKYPYYKYNGMWSRHIQDAVSFLLHSFRLLL